MGRNIAIRIANILAILMLVTMMNSIAPANEGGLSLPQHGSEPVTVRFSEGAVDWEDAKAIDMLQVYVGAIDQCCEGRTPVAGRYTLDNNSLTFTPAFSFVTGQDYVARVRIAGMDEKFVKLSPLRGVVVAHHRACYELFRCLHGLSDATSVRFFSDFRGPDTVRA